MNKTGSTKFVSVVLLSFPSRVQYDLWYQKYRTFYSPNAIEFLKNNGQVSQSANLVDEENDLIRVSLIWVYRHREAYKACQKFHGQWAKIGGEYIGKASGYRGEQIWGFN